MQRIIVDLPEPEGPQTTTRSPLPTCSEMSLRTWNSPYHLWTARSSIIGLPVSARSAVAVLVIDETPWKSTRRSSTPPGLVEVALEILAVFGHEEAETPVDHAN